MKFPQMLMSSSTHGHRRVRDQLEANLLNLHTARALLPHFLSIALRAIAFVLPNLSF